MKRTFLSLAFAIAAAVFCASSCLNIDVDDEPQKELATIGVYVLNQGSWLNNDASLTFFSTINQQVQGNVFKTANDKKLGDTAQDICIFGDKMYISVFGSAVVFVVDPYSCKLMGEIRASSSETGEVLSPRYLVPDGNSLYVSYYEGYVGKVDTTSISVAKLVKVGDNPEEMAVSGSKLFVTNSGALNYPDYGNTVSVIDLATFEVINTIEVKANPNQAVSDGNGHVFVLSFGNYSDVPACLQKIDAATYTVEEVTAVANPMDMALGRDKILYIISSYFDDNWNSVSDLLKYNIATGECSKFITDGKTIPNLYSISADLLTGSIYIGSSDYASTGTIYAFSYEGQFITKFSAAGLNPFKVMPIMAEIYYY